MNNAVVVARGIVVFAVVLMAALSAVAENLLILKSKELAKAYIENWMKHLEHSEAYLN